MSVIESNKKRRGEKSNLWRGGKIPKLCLLCGKEYFVKRSHGNRESSKYCSRECMGKSQRTGIYKNCLNCGEKVYFVPTDLKKGGGKYCSKKCQALHKINNMFGKHNPMWKGGISKLKARIINCHKYKYWRMSVFIRDNFRCVDCGNDELKLNAHHIKPMKKMFEEIKEYMPLLNTYDACMLYVPFWDVKNGRTLCESCHLKYHKRKQ